MGTARMEQRRGFPAPPVVEVMASHALAAMLKLQSELEALKRTSAAEITKLSAALSEARVECDSLRTDLELAERAADGRWRAAARVVWRWRVRAELQKAHQHTASRLLRREEDLTRREGECALQLKQLGDGAQARLARAMHARALRSTVPRSLRRSRRSCAAPFRRSASRCESVLDFWGGGGG